MNEDAKAGLRRIEGPSAALVSEQDKRSSQQHYLDGVVYFQKGDYSEAKDEWRLSLSLDRENSDARAGLERIEKLYSSAPGAEGYSREEKRASVTLSDKAKKALSNASAPVTDQARRDSQQHYLANVIFFQKGDYVKARDEWVLSLQNDPSNADACPDQRQ